MLERLDFIIAIVEEQNLTKAAKRLFISQPALTKYINKLEKDYGVTLFDRSHLPVTLTPAGQIFLSEKIKMNLAEQALRNKLRSVQSGKITLSIGTGYARIQNWMPLLLKSFCSAHPTVDIHLHASGELSLPDKIKRGDFDMILGAFPTDDLRDFNAHRLTREHLRLLIPLSLGILPPDLAVEETFLQPYMLDPQQLNGQNLISAGRDMGSYYNYQLLMQQYQIVSQREIMVDGMRAIHQMIHMGLGYAYVSVKDASILKGQNGDWIAACATLAGLPLTRITTAAYNPRHPHAELLDELLSTLLQHIRGAMIPNAQYWED